MKAGRAATMMEGWTHVATIKRRERIFRVWYGPELQERVRAGFRDLICFGQSVTSITAEDLAHVRVLPYRPRLPQ